MGNRLALREGWTTFWLIAILVLIATWSLHFTTWARDLDMLFATSVLGLLVGLAVTRLRLPAPVAHAIALAIGAVVVLYHVTGALSDQTGGVREKLGYLWLHGLQWIEAVTRGHRVEDLSLFILFVTAVIWVLSYSSVWFVFRSGWVWPTVLSPGVILLANMGYSPDVPRVLVVLYIFAAILLLMRFSYMRKELSWRREGLPYPQSLAWRGLLAATYLACAVLLVGWVVPLSPQGGWVIEEWVQSDGPWRRLGDRFYQWVPPSRQLEVSANRFTTFGTQFKLGGSLRLTDEPVLVVEGNVAPYLAAQHYNVFTGQGWTTDIKDRAQEGQQPSRSRPPVTFKADQTLPTTSAAGQERVEQQFRVQVIRPDRSAIFYAGEPARVSVPTRLRVASFPYVQQELEIQTMPDEAIPPDLQPLVRLLQTADLSTPRASTEAATTAASAALLEAIASEQRRLAQQGIATDFNLGPDGSVTTLDFSGRLPVYADVEALSATQEVKTGDSYRVVSLISKASADQLREAGTDYPVEITTRYLQLPQYSDRTQALAEELARGHDNAYDVAVAIETYLRQNLSYNENIDDPPPGRDLVDYFLFESKQGYCTYYTSAMAEMLRILGIPSRIATGYFPAPYDSEAGGYLYRDRNAHSWVEVYFPQYGWIPFEPTAARSPILRDGLAAVGEAAGTNPNPAPSSPEEAADTGTGDNSERRAAGDGWWHFAADDWMLWMIGITLLGSLLVGVALLWFRGLRRMSPTSQLFTKVYRGASWTGLPAEPSMTPYEYAAMIARRVRGARSHVRLLADLYVRERYGRRSVSPSELGQARESWLSLRWLLLRDLLFHRWNVWRHRDEGNED